MSDRSDGDWLDRPRTVRLIVRALVATCAALVLADLAYDKEAHLAVEGWVGFHGVFGFVACVFLVLAAKQLRRLVKRREDYYD